MAAQIDFYALQGTGTGGAPTGLLSTAGLVTSALGVNGAAPTFANLIDVERQVSQRNGIIQSIKMGWVGNTKVRATMRAIVKTSGFDFLWQDAQEPQYDGWVIGYPAAVTNNVPSTLVKGTSGATLSALIFGNWADLFIVQFGPVAIIVDPYSFSNTGAVRYNVFQEVDIQPRRTDSFCAIVDMIAS
jgi:HK97 family phage major capsid protein